MTAQQAISSWCIGPTYIISKYHFLLSNTRYYKKNVNLYSSLKYHCSQIIIFFAR